MTSGLPSRRLLLAAAVATVIVGTAAAPAQSARRACHPGHSRVVLRTAALLLYAERDRSLGSTTLYGCARRNGHTSELGTSEDLETRASSYRVLAHAGTGVVVATSAGSQYDSTDEVRWWHLLTGRSAAVYRSFSPLAGTKQTTGYQLVRALLTPDGCTLLGATAEVQVIAERFRGAAQVLDSGLPAALPPSSLSLRGQRASWLHDGVARTADLPAGCRSR